MHWTILGGALCTSAIGVAWYRSDLAWIAIVVALLGALLLGGMPKIKNAKKEMARPLACICGRCDRKINYE